MTVKPLPRLARTTGRRGLPFDVRIPNALTARTLCASKAGKNVKRFGSKRELFVDLGL
jgi:antitoxin component of RelBE/YafQ-DinJ toxin-antitoxin module